MKKMICVHEVGIIDQSWIIDRMSRNCSRGLSQQRLVKEAEQQSVTLGNCNEVHVDRNSL